MSIFTIFKCIGISFRQTTPLSYMQASCPHSICSPIFGEMTTASIREHSKSFDGILTVGRVEYIRCVYDPFLHIVRHTYIPLDSLTLQFILMSSHQNTPTAPVEPTLTKAVPMQSDQCAVNADGTLKDASEIDWFHDPDNITPIGTGPVSLASSIGTSTTKAKKNAFDVLGKPATVIASQRRTSRPHKPRIDPDNAEAFHPNCTFFLPNFFLHCY